MTRDAELPTRDFVAAVLLHARVEAEVTVLERLLSQALAAIDQFGDPANRETARAGVAGIAWEQLSAAEPGGDVQLTWARAHIAAADSSDDLDRLERLLDGAQSVPGLSIDNDLRWMIVGRLAGLGRDPGPRIEAQLAADDTDFGRRRAAACRAAQPDAAVKRAAFDQVVGGADLPLQTLNALMGGFGVGPFAIGGLGPMGRAPDRPAAPLRGAMGGGGAGVLGAAQHRGGGELHRVPVPAPAGGAGDPGRRGSGPGWDPGRGPLGLRPGVRPHGRSSRAGTARSGR